MIKIWPRIIRSLLLCSSFLNEFHLQRPTIIEIFLSASTITRFSGSYEVSVVKRRNIGHCLPSSARSAQKDIRETSFPAIFLPIPPGSLSVLSTFPSLLVSLPLLDRQPRATESARGWEKEDRPKR